MNKCGDCGTELNKDNHSKTERSICDGCYSVRGDVVEGTIVPFNSEEFIKIQRKMASRNGTAKAYIDSLRERMGEE